METDGQVIFLCSLVNDVVVRVTERIRVPDRNKIHANNLVFVPQPVYFFRSQFRRLWCRCDHPVMVIVAVQELLDKDVIVDREQLFQHIDPVDELVRDEKWRNNRMINVEDIRVMFSQISAIFDRGALDAWETKRPASPHVWAVLLATQNVTEWLVDLGDDLLLE